MKLAVKRLGMGIAVLAMTAGLAACKEDDQAMTMEYDGANTITVKADHSSHILHKQTESFQNHGMILLLNSEAIVPRKLPSVTTRCCVLSWKNSEDFVKIVFDK